MAEDSTASLSAQITWDDVRKFRRQSHLRQKLSLWIGGSFLALGILMSWFLFFKSSNPPPPLPVLPVAIPPPERPPEVDLWCRYLSSVHSNTAVNVGVRLLGVCGRPKLGH